MSTPLVAVTTGDANGVGPELVARVLMDDGIHRWRAIVVGDPDVLRAALERLGSGLRVQELAALDAATFDPEIVEVLVPEDGRVEQLRPGEEDAAAGRASLKAFELAAALALDGRIDGLLSSPVSKRALHLAGMTQPDELTLLAELTARPVPLLVGVLDGLLTACVTLHVPLRDVPALVTRERVVATARDFLAVLRRLSPRPRLMVAGLNPHAGEGGLLGRDEIDAIAPAVRDLRTSGFEVIGPVAPDSVFPQAKLDHADGVLCMYHDQANIARKLAGIRGATLFVGLPVPVATTAHGTAYDLVGTGRADPVSMRLARDRLLELVGDGQ
jgi:4-hydroxythreonine-4-phosphate dehydrogenase